MIRMTLFIWLVLVCSSVSGQLTGDFVTQSERYRGQAEKDFKAAAKTMNAELAFVKRGVVRKEQTKIEVVNGKLVYPSQEEKDNSVFFVNQAIQKVNEMAKAAANQYPVPPLDLVRERYGNVGYLHTAVEVKQVVDATTVIGNIIVNDVRVEVWLTGINTDGVADDDLYSLTSWNDGLYMKDGSHSYGTVIGGQRTLPVVRSVSAEEIQKIIPEGKELLYLTQEQVKVLRSAMRK